MTQNHVNQNIHCSVCSCSYHNHQNYCTLDSIKVEARPNANTGAPADESLCGSYKCRS